MRNQTLDALLQSEYKGKGKYPIIPALSLLFSSLIICLWHSTEVRIQKYEAQWKASEHVRVPLRKPAAPNPSPVLHKVRLNTDKAPEKTDFNSMVLNEKANQRQYTYIFEGKALHKRKPCDKASVLVHVTTPYQSLTQGTITDADGDFRIEVALKTGSNDPVDYAMEAYTQDFKQVEFVGRRIVTQEESPVTITGPFAFLPK